MKITLTQNKILHGLLNSTGMIGQKANLVLSFTKGRSESSKDLLASEAQELIGFLKTQDKGHTEAANKMRRKILAFCHRIQWTTAPGKVDVDRLDRWCINNSYLKKPLNDYTYNELPKLVSEFQQVYKYYQNAVS